MQPIGLFHCDFKEKYEASRQPGMEGVNGIIKLQKGCLYEQALEDLDGFQRIWILFLFDRVNNWKPKVFPPRGEKKRGVFATRSPHRPNPVGLSCVELIRINGLELHVGSHDLLDQTPIIDIKPYLPYADAFPDAHAGWTEAIADVVFLVRWTREAEEQGQFIKNHLGPDLFIGLRNRLETNPFPSSSRRIRQLEGNGYEIAYKSWRIQYILFKEAEEVLITGIRSGYRCLEGNDMYGDFSLHQEFNNKFSGLGR